MDLRQMDTNVAGGLDATLNEVSVALEAQMESTPGKQRCCCDTPLLRLKTGLLSAADTGAWLSASTHHAAPCS
jgi:hypothetical protein